jgi:hypothetical protein
MRIESAVGCPTSAGESAEDKTVRDGSTGLFTNILDCFRVLLSGSLSEDAATCETPAATGKPADRSQIVRADTSIFPVMHESSATRPNTDSADELTLRKNCRELPATCPGPAPTVPIGVTFNLAAPEFAETGQPSPGTQDGSARPAGAIGEEVLTAAAARMPSGFAQQAETLISFLNRQDGVSVDDTAASRSEIEAGEESTTSADSAADLNLKPESPGQCREVANPPIPTPAASQAAPAVMAQATATVLMMGMNLGQPDQSSVNTDDTPVPSSFSVHSAPGMPWTRGTETQSGFAAASVTSWMPPRSGNAAKGDMGHAVGSTVKGEAEPETTALPEGSSAYSRVIRVDDGTVQAADASVEARLAGSNSPAQKLPDKALSPNSGQPTDRQEVDNRAEARRDSADFRAEAHLQSQAESTTRPAGAFKAAAVDPATPAVDSEKISAGRSRLRAVVEGGAREDSTMSSLSGVARDAQSSSQATAGVRDVKAPAFVFEVAERISTVVAGNRGEVTIQLKPDQFGRMNIVAESGASGILARITTESASLKQYLESNLPVLQQALQDQGLKVERIDVLVQEGLLQQQSANQWQQNLGHSSGGHDTDGNARSATTAPTRPAEPAHEITLDAIILGALHPNSTFHTIA